MVGPEKQYFWPRLNILKEEKMKNSVDAMVKVIYLHHKFITKSMNQIIKIRRF